ncbi:MAG TPA: hypothetical protein VN641_15365 [Urbifossiella sp.]|nr:hypothetical protein [Urbifossiella sp.]
MVTPARGPALRHYLLVCAVAAAAIDFGRVQRSLNADAILFTVASQCDWTPFFWEQDRIGLLVPLFTSWIADPFAALLLQTGITAFMGLALPLLLMEVVYPQPAGRFGAMLASALLLAIAPDRVRGNLLFECTYPQAMFLGCVGLLILGRGDRPRWWRYPLGFACFALAHWTYLGVCVWLMPLAFWIAVVRPGAPLGGIREFLLRLVRYFPGWSSLLLLGGAAALGWWFSTLADGSASYDAALPVREWPRSWFVIGCTFLHWPDMERWLIVAGTLAVAGSIATIAPRFRPGCALPAAAFVLAIVAATEFAFIGTRQWPSRNENHFRYILGAIAAIETLLGLMATAPLARLANRRPWITFAAAATLLFTGAVVQYGFPMPGARRGELDELHGVWLTLRDANVDAIGGQYWVVWPAYLYLRIAAEPGEIVPYPMAFRGSTFRKKWERTHPHGMRVAILADSRKEKKELDVAARRYHFSKPVFLERFGRFDLYFVEPVASRRGEPRNP